MYIKACLIVLFLLEATTTVTEKESRTKTANVAFVTPTRYLAIGQPEEEEETTTVNVPISCSLCDPFGTSACEEVAHGRICVCKPHWQGSRCEQPPNHCEHTPLDCGINGNCTSLTDRAYCSCEEGYVGDHCQIAKDQIEFYSEDAVSFASLTTLSALILMIIDLLTVSLKGTLALYRLLPVEDSQTFYQVFRSLAVLLAGSVVLLFRHPAIFHIPPSQCKMWFYIATTSFSIGIGSFAMEALHNAVAIRKNQRHSWPYDSAPETSSKAMPVTSKMVPVLLLSVAITIPYMMNYQEVSSAWSCMGRFSFSAIDFWYPVVLLNLCVAIAATCASYYTFFIKKNLPQLAIENRACPDADALIAQYSSENRRLEAIVTIVGPWVLLGSWLTLAISCDFVSETSVNIAALAFSLLYATCIVIQLIFTTPILHGKFSIGEKSLSQRFSPLFTKGLYTCHERKEQKSLTEFNPMSLWNRWMEMYAKARMEQENGSKSAAFYKVYTNVIDSHCQYEDKVAVREQGRYLFKKWANQTKSIDPQEDCQRNGISLETYCAELKYSEVLESLAVIKPINSEIHGKCWFALDNYLNAMAYDPFEMCPILTICSRGYTTSRRFLRTPINILGPKVSDKLTTCSRTNREHVQEDEEEEPNVAGVFDAQWMMTEADKIKLALKSEIFNDEDGILDC